MPIKVFEQGESSRSDKELYSLIGHWLVDVRIHQRLGTAVTSKHKDLWFVSVSEKGEPRGFASARILKNGKMHIRFVHCEEGAQIICDTMIKKFLNVANEKSCKEVYTNDTVERSCWLSAGFEFTQPARGRYGKWVKSFE